MRKNEEPKRFDQPRRRKPATTTTERGYGYDWQRLRNAWMSADIRYCVHCSHQGLLIPATVVDHIIPHRGDDKLRLDWNNLQGLCVKCHTAKTLQYDGGLGNEIRPYVAVPAVPLEELVKPHEMKQG